MNIQKDFLWVTEFTLADQNHAIIISACYTKLPKVINLESKKYLTGKGFSVLPEIKKEIKAILESLLSVAQQSIVEENSIQLAGLEPQKIDMILNEVYTRNKQQAIDPVMAVWGAICKSFWEFCDNIFLPDDMRNIYFKDHFNYYESAIKLFSVWSCKKRIENKRCHIISDKAFTEVIVSGKSKSITAYHNL